MYAETRQGEQRDKAAKYDALGLKKPTVSTEGYLSRMAPIYKPKNVLSYGFELKVNFDDCELSTEDQNRIFLHLMEITGDKFMLKKPGRYYYGHMFGMMMLSSVWLYLRHLIPGISGGNSMIIRISPEFLSARCNHIYIRRSACICGHLV